MNKKRISFLFAAFLATGLFAGFKTANHSNQTHMELVKADATVAKLSDMTVWWNWPAGVNNFNLVCFFSDGQNDLSVCDTYDTNALYDCLKDNFLINGETLAEINQKAEGTVKIGNIGGNHKVTISIKDTYLKLDGTDLFVLNSGVTFPNGVVTTEKFAKEMFFVNLTRPAAPSSQECKFRDCVDNPTTAVLHSLSVYWNYPATGFNLVYTFFNGSNITVYNSFNEQLIYYCIKDSFLINGETLAEINAKTANSVKVVNIGQSHKITLSIAESVLKLDGTDTFVVKQGIRFPNGNISDSDTGFTMYECTLDKGTNSQGGCLFKAYSDSAVAAPLYSLGVYWNYPASGFNLVCTFRGSTDVPVYKYYNADKIYNSIKDGILINGETLAEINAKTANSVKVVNIGQSHKITLSIAESVLKLDGTDMFTISKDITFPNGNYTSKDTHKIMYSATLDKGTAWQEGCKFKATAVETGEVAAFHSCVDYYNSWGAGTEVLNFIFNDGSKDIPVYSCSTTELMEILGHKITLNGKYLDEYESGVSFRDIGSPAKICINISHNANILKLDGTDYVEFDDDIVLPNGAVPNKKICAYIYNHFSDPNPNSNSKVANVVISGEEMTCIKPAFYNFSAADSSHYMMIEFDKSLNNPEVNSGSECNKILEEKMLFNGKTIAQLNSEVSGSVSVLGWNQGSNGVKLFISVKDSVFNYDGTDTFELKSGVVSPSKRITKEDVSFTLGGLSFVENVTPTGEETTLKSCSIYNDPQKNGYDWVYVNFNGDVFEGDQYYAPVSDIYNKISLNGKTLGQLEREGLKFSIEWAKTDQLLLRIENGKDNSIKFDGNDRLVITEGFVGQNGTTVTDGFDKYWDPSNNGDFKDKTTVKFGDSDPVSIFVGNTLGSITIPSISEKQADAEFTYRGKWVDGNGTEYTSDTVINEAVELTVAYDSTKVQYSVSYLDENDESISGLGGNVANGSDVTLAEVPAKTGYTGHWESTDVTLDGNTFEMPTKNVTLKAVYEANSYELSFEGVTDPMTVTYGQAVGTLPAVPAREGYHNGKWMLNGEELTAETVYNFTEDKEVVASYTKNVYEVTFDSNGGSSVTASTVEHGGKVTKPADPTREGYTFKGWFVGETAYDFNSEVTGVVTLTAKWEIKSFIVTFDSNGGSNVDVATVEHGAKVTKPADPTREGYTFKGWFVGETAYDFNSEVTGAVTLTAKWEIKSFTVTFDSNGGSNVDVATVEHGAKVTKPADPTREGYTFKGWFVGETAYDFNSEVTANVSLTAKWEVIPVTPEKEDGPEAKGGCGGSILAGSAIITLVSALGACLLASKKKED